MTAVLEHSSAVRSPELGNNESVGRENHKLMLDHYQQTKNMLVSYSPRKLGFF